jgi:hypothetical protein
LRKCDFLTEKLGISRIQIRNYLFRIRILQKVPDPTGSGSGSTTLQKSLGPLEISFEMAHYVVCPQKKIISRIFKLSGALIV